MWKRLSATVLISMSAAAGLVASEALFFVTKRSFLSTIAVGAAAEASLLAVVYAMSLAGVLAILSGGLERALSRGGFHRTARVVGSAPAVVLLGGTLFLLFDTFTYTVLDFGVIDTTTGLQGLYLLGLGLLLARLSASVPRATDWLEHRSTSGPVGALGLLTSAFLLLWVAVAPTPGSPPERIEERNAVDVIILSGDGIELRHTSLGAYFRDTTPFLTELSAESIIAPRHYTNAASTGGAVVALLSGRDPLTTGVINATHALHGQQAFEHLPGLLRRAGYRTVDESLRDYADATDLNLREGFLSANHRDPRGWVGALIPLGRRHPTAALLLEKIRDRLSERLLHLAFVQRMVKRHRISAVQRSAEWNDESRVSALLQEIDNATDIPYFAHVHLLGTHGPLYHVEQPHWSQGQQLDKPYLRDFYDDAIRDFDRVVERVYRRLEERGRLDRTLLIINSDHGIRWATREPLPLVMRFPGGQPRGVLDAPTQRLDIAPTVLDQLGFAAPEWMEGRSLLRRPAPLSLPIFGVSHFSGPTPDGYGALGVLSLVECGQAASIVLVTNEIVQEQAADEAPWCPPRILSSPESTRAAFEERLRQHGYDPAALGTLRMVPAGTVPP
jgi:hypothetical protein